MAIRKTMFLWTFLLFGTSIQAQDVLNKAPMNDINVIKRDTSYIYAESTRLDALEAQSDAKVILELKVQDWLRSKHLEEDAPVLISDSKDRWFSLLTKRGKYNRLFVYVAKRDIIPMPEKIEPIIQKSVSEEPGTVSEVVTSSELTADEKNMASIIIFADIEPYVKGLKEESKLRAYGKYASLPEDDVCYILVYDRDGIVVAVIRQSADGRHFNLRTQSEDNVRNYKNCGAIWLQFK